MKHAPLILLCAAALLPACTTVTVDPRPGSTGGSGSAGSPHQSVYVINNSPGANSPTTTNTLTHTHTQEEHINHVSSFSDASTSVPVSPYDASRYDN